MEFQWQAGAPCGQQAGSACPLDGRWGNPPQMHILGFLDIWSDGTSEWGDFQISQRERYSFSAPPRRLHSEGAI